MTTIGTLLSGGECVGVGAREAGLTHLWGFEIEDDIAQVARDNGFNVITADVMQLDPYTLEVPDVLHASPVCKRASNANQSAELNEDGTKEAPEDVAIGEKIASFIDVMQPGVFTCENVYAYRNFKAFKIICNALERGGYMWDFDNLNAADYGVPQTRRRLILRAIRGALLPNLPQPEKWIGWYSAIEDLIPGLPDSQFAKWQLARLPEIIRQSLLVDSAGYPDETGARVAVQRKASEPANTIVANYERRPMRAFIIDQLNYHKDGTRNSTVRLENEPIWSLPVHSTKHPEPRSFIVDQNYGNSNAETERRLGVRTDAEPVFTITARGPKAEIRAFLVGGGNTQLGQIDSKARNELEPSFTVFAGDNHRTRAWLREGGRVVGLTVGALARLQSIPRDYRFSGNKKIDCKIVGNAVCPLLYQKIISPLVAGI